MSATQLAAKERETEVAMSADRRLVDLHPGQLGVPEEPLQASSKWLRFARKLKAIAAPLGRKSGNGGGARGWYLGLFLLTCAAPALLALVYYMFVAADQYEVEVRFNV